MSRRENPSSAKLVGLGGFEPPTSPLSGVRSNQLSYRPGILKPSLHLVDTVIGDDSYVLYDKD